MRLGIFIAGLRSCADVNRQGRRTPRRCACRSRTGILGRWSTSGLFSCVTTEQSMHARSRVANLQRRARGHGVLV